MLRFLLYFILFIFISHWSLAQITVPGIPESFLLKTKNLTAIPFKELNAIDTVKLIYEDQKQGINYRYGVAQQVDIDIKKEGVKTEVPNKGNIWQYKLTSSQAYSIGISFGFFLLPEGASVFLYNDNHKQIFGAFTSINNNSENHLTLADFSGQNVIIEYFEPSNPAFSGQLKISSVVQAYRNISSTLASRIGINCTEGFDYQDVKHAVCRMTYHDTQYSYTCTGFLINNVRNDGTPYFQTANHCVNTSYEAATLVTYFNYENSSCTNSDASLLQTLSGATLKATNSYSDFTLLLLNEYPPAKYNPFFLGWDASLRSPLKGACIHHPSGTPKCIAIDNSPPVSYTGTIQWTDNNGTVVSTTVANSNWQVNYDVGSSETGSSGAPVLDDKLRVIGQLHGGSNSTDYFGKFSLSWNSGTTDATQLKYWLDPDKTGVLAIDGFYSTFKPKASFATELTRVCPGAVIKFNDRSKYNPTSWNWIIQPETYQFANGTTNKSKNPEIIFTIPGFYTIGLTAINKNGTDSIALNDYINAGDIKVKMTGITTDSLVCGCNLIDYPIKANGASNYSFNIERPDKIKYNISADSLFLSLIPAEKKNGSFDFRVKVIGSQGLCTSSDSIKLKISIPVNDDIENAITLRPGRNKPFSNFCASVQANEAAPSFIRLNNTIWFNFYGPPTGVINFDIIGFNEKISIYDSESYKNLISGNTNSYKLLATFKNLSTLDNIIRIREFAVEPYKKYWLQIDGLDGATVTSVIDFLSNHIEVYPNPSNGKFKAVFSHLEDGNADIKIYSITGKELYLDNIDITKENNTFEFNLASYPAGVYFILAKINGKTMEKKFSILK